MTIRKQYQLPNCSLILDGLSIDPTPGQEGVMSLLVNAECRISGLERSLNGGYNFFAALVRAVSQYSQEVLSGFAHPQVIEGEPLLVHINPGDGPYHHLVVQPEIADMGESGDGRAIDIKLSAVQLFDLTEAVDQFFDDSQTLPELEPALSPLPRRFVRTEEPLSDRALPAVLGVGSLVAATMAVGLLPMPELREPTARLDETAEVSSTKDNLAEGTPPTGDGSDPEPDSITAANLTSPLWEKAPRITDEATISDLQASLESQISENLNPDNAFTESLEYQVAVNEAGEVVGYQFANDAALRDVDSTPLPKLARENAEAEGLEENAIAQYEVAFSADGVAVSPFQEASADAPEVDETEVAIKPAALVDETDEKSAASPDANASTETEPQATGAEGSETEGTTSEVATIQETESEDEFAPGFDDYDDFEGDDPTANPSTDEAAETFSDDPPDTLRSLTEVEALNNQLKRTLVENRDQPRFGDATTYRVRFNEDGEIVGYLPITQTAEETLAETPLPQLLESTPKESAAVDYRVVFTERGVVEVSPWWGWSYYE